MNETASVNRVLVWKEVRQIVPLMLMLLGVGALLLLFWSGMMITTHQLVHAGRYLPLILPALFAAGVGTVQIGQEKETRTIQWLSSIPITPRRLILTKFAVALGGLAVMWLCCFVLIALAVVSGVSEQSNFPGLAYVDFNDLIHFPLHSVFILTCAVLSAWRIKNPFASLLAIVPLALLPTLAMVAIERLLRWTGSYLFDEQRFWLTLAVTMVSAAGYVWLAYRIACRGFEPAAAPSVKSTAADWLEGWKPPQVLTSGIARPTFRYPMSSLIWQSIHHHRWVLAGISSMVLVGAVCAALSCFPYFHRAIVEPTLGWGMFAGFVGVSWLGVFVFIGDGSQHGLRFLADRGISPSQVWWGRQWIGLSILSAGILLYALLTLSPVLSQHLAANSIMSVATVTVCCLLTYSVSQWTSQLIRILSAAALLAPLFTVFAIYGAGFSSAFLEVPYWLTSLLYVGLPLLTSWLLMHRFMDNQRGFSFYFYSILLVSLAVLIPLLMFAIEVGNSLRSRVPKQNRLVAAAMALPRDGNRFWSLSRRDTELRREFGESRLTGSEVVVMKRETWVDPHNRFNLAELQSDSLQPIHAHAEFVKEIINLATYSKLKLQHSPEDEEAYQSLQRWIVDLTRLGKGLRLSERWLDQMAADVVEIWLTQTLSTEPLSGQADRAFVQQAIAFVGDSAGRDAARRRAVVLTWSFPPQNIDYDRLGFNMRSRGRMSDYRQSWFQDALVVDVVDASLRLLEDGQQGRSTLAARRELHELIFDARVSFEDGPYADQNLIGIGDDSTFSMTDLFAYPAMSWHAPWEGSAARLVVGRALPGKGE